MDDIVENLRATADDTDAVENASVAYLLEEAAAEIERLRKRESLWQWCAAKTAEMYGGCYRPEYAAKVEAVASALAGDPR